MSEGSAKSGITRGKSGSPRLADRRVEGIPFHQLGLEGALPVARHLDDHMPLLAFERFLAMPIAAVATGMALASMFWVA